MTPALRKQIERLEKPLLPFTRAFHAIATAKGLPLAAYARALGTLCLETYYRYLPLFKK